MSKRILSRRRIHLGAAIEVAPPAVVRFASHTAQGAGPHRQLISVDGYHRNAILRKPAA
jgi:hypothetical protein